MKKTIKRITITLVTIFAFLGVSTTALAATGYVKKEKPIKTSLIL